VRGGSQREFRSSKLESRMTAFLQNSKFEIQDSRFFSNPSDHLFPLDLSAVLSDVASSVAKAMEDRLAKSEALAKRECRDSKIA
jgi:hypothetical protein